jgi:hypothetical protein
MAITNQEIAVIKKMVAKTRAVTDPQVDARSVHGAHPQVKELMAAQNVLRDCITVVFNECMPIDRSFVLEMAMRLASYAVSVAPVEDQMILARGVTQLFEDFHLKRMQQGIGIPADWITDGVEHKNMPTKGNTN